MAGTRHPPPDGAIRAIALFKIVKGTLLLALAAGAFSLLGRNAAARVTDWVNRLRVDPENRWLHAMIAKLAIADPKTLEEAEVGTFVYAGLTLAEGVGLALRRRWGESITVAATGAFIPLEIAELVRHVSAVRLGLLALNVAIVGYLVVRLRRS
jgi:uncharacterized membrane protein (DUF2068 family)